MRQLFQTNRTSRQEYCTFHGKWDQQHNQEDYCLSGVLSVSLLAHRSIRNAILRDRVNEERPNFDDCSELREIGHLLFFFSGGPFPFKSENEIYQYITEW